MRTLLLMCSLVMACGGEAGQGPAPADGGDAAADASADRWTGQRPECQARRMLDCNNDGACDTPSNELNCGACGRSCRADQVCGVGGTLCI